jgi:hypothetical protein
LPQDGFIAEGVMRYCMERDGDDITCYFICENNFAGDPDSFFAYKPSEKKCAGINGLYIDKLFA